MASKQDRSHLSRRGFLKRLAGVSNRTVESGQQPEIGRVTFDTPVITPAGRFFRQVFRRGRAAPIMDLDTWALRVAGLVDTPFVLSYSDLRALPTVGGTMTLACMGDSDDVLLIGNAVWRGCALDDLLTRAGTSDAARVRFDSADGYHTSMPLPEIQGCDAILAYEMNGAVLPPEHGFPLRLIMPGRYGTKSPKWLTAITLVAEDHRGLWEGAPHHWSDEAAVKTCAYFMHPAQNAVVEVGERVALQGVAFAGARHITAVEVSVDGSPWMPATLRASASPYEWTQWYVTWVPPIVGDTEIQVRATDETGFTQYRPPARFDAFPDGSDAMQRLVLRVV